MNDIYKKQLTKEQKIYLLLLEKIHDPNICRNIIGMKIKKERIETDNYHYDLWLNIALKFYKAKKGNLGNFSYILDEEIFFIKPDHDLDFFRKTGVSYQIKEMINNLIEISMDDELLKYDDNLYSQLAKKIMEKMII